MEPGRNGKLSPSFFNLPQTNDFLFQWLVQEIRDHKVTSQGKKVLVKYVGYREVSWQPFEFLAETEAWHDYKKNNNVNW